MFAETYFREYIRIESMLHVKPCEDPQWRVITTCVRKKQMVNKEINIL